MKRQLMLWFVIGVILIVSSLIAGCSGRSSTDGNAGTSDNKVDVVEPTRSEQTTEGEDTQAEDIGSTGTTEDRLPEDVPIISGYRNISITSDGSNISYEVDGSIEDVVTFYQEELASFGWEMTRSPDNAYSAFGSMARVNEAGDRVTFSLQYNPIGEFVIVRIVILRG